MLYVETNKIIRDKDFCEKTWCNRCFLHGLFLALVTLHLHLHNNLLLYTSCDTKISSFIIFIFDSYIQVYRRFKIIFASIVFTIEFMFHKRKKRKDKKIPSFWNTSDGKYWSFWEKYFVLDKKVVSIVQEKICATSIYLYLTSKLWHTCFLFFVSLIEKNKKGSCSGLLIVLFSAPHVGSTSLIIVKISGPLT